MNAISRSVAKIISLLAALAPILSVGAQTEIGAQGDSLINDPIVEARFRSAIKKPRGQLTPADLKQEVWRLDLRFARVTDAGLKEVAKLTGIKELLFSFEARITDTGLKDIAKLPQLEGLSLMECSITDAGLREVAKLKKLKGLNLQRTKVTTAGIAALQKALPNCKILPSPASALLRHPIAKGHWTYRNGKPETVTFDYGTKLTAQELDRLSQVESITRISMGYAGVDSEYVTIEGDLAKLGRLKNLKAVHLCKDGINDDDLRFVALLPMIHTLEFNADNGYAGAPICTDQCADQLSAAKTLRVLLIHDGRFTDKFVAQITRALPNLEQLWLNSPDLTDESLRLIAERCRNLKSLWIASDHFTTSGLKHLDKLPHLRRSVNSPSLRKKAKSSNPR